MIKLFGVAPFLAVLLLLTAGCAGDAVIQGGVSAATATSIASGTGKVKASETFVEATTPEQRALRACMATAIVSEVWTYRLVYTGSTPEEKLLARASMTEMLSSIDNLNGVTGGVWFETEMFYALNTMLRSVAPAIRDRILSGVENALGGSVIGLITELETTVVQVALAKIMKRDVQALFDSADLTSEAGLTAGFEACSSRIEKNIGKL